MYKEEIKYVLSKAEEKGMNDVEVKIAEENVFSIDIFNKEVDRFDYYKAFSLGIRVIENGVSGIAYTESMEKPDLDKTLDAALQSAKYTAPDTVDDELLPKGEYKKIEGLDTDEFEKLDVKEKIKMAVELEESAKAYDPRIKHTPICGLSYSKNTMILANSKGIDNSYTSSQGIVFIMTGAEDNGLRKSSMDYQLFRTPSELNPSEVATRCAKRTIALLNTKEIDTGKYPVVFENKMFASILEVFAPMFSSQLAQKNLSLFKDKEGQVIANEKVCLLDDATLPGGTASRPFDNEGYPSQRTYLIENGVFKSFLYNTKTAKKAGVKSTGNADGGVNSPLELKATNFFLQKGDKSFEELISANGKCLLITSLAGLHSGANSISGEFSLQAEGFLYEDGKLLYPVDNFTVSGNFVEILKDIDMIGEDLVFSYESFGSPSVLIKELSIAGK